MANEIILKMFNTYLKDVQDASAKCSELSKKLMDDSINDDDYAVVCREARHAESDYDAACHRLSQFIATHADQIRFE